MTLTSGDIDLLKHVAPHTLQIRARTDPANGDLEDLWLVCTKVSDARLETIANIVRLDGGMELDQILRLVLDHHLACHEPRGHH